MLHQECIYCRNSENDPEYGFACSIGQCRTDNGRYCIHYKVDAEYLRRDVEGFIQRHLEYEKGDK